MEVEEKGADCLQKRQTEHEKFPRNHNLLTIAPKATKAHVVVPIRRLDQCRVNRVVRLRRSARDPRGAVVRPGAVFHCRGRGISDSRGL